MWLLRGVGDAGSIDRVVLVALKHERELLVFVERDGTVQHVTTFPILAASGTAGPKLREGDRQVPEGFYGISFLNPNSRFHLSLRVDYPNREDIDAATADGRDTGTLGGDIMIHGGANSIGCVAIGDEPIEDIFWLVATVGIDRTRVVIAAGSEPGDHLRPDAPAWLRDRSLRIESELRRLKVGV
ncbi:MAG TPA: L,D-transpeptidase family protein [Phycisphaerales bacterium]|nr:L,D-transpeptidase family protein [Phycisphaerales bacterium]